jgi:hypothetical protein
MKANCQEYEWTLDESNGRLTCLRHGVAWRDETGDGAILALLQEYDRLRELLGELRKSFAEDEIDLTRWILKIDAALAALK